jgi:hypothetical protein
MVSEKLQEALDQADIVIEDLVARGGILNEEQAAKFDDLVEAADLMLFLWYLPYLWAATRDGDWQEVTQAIEAWYQEDYIEASRVREMFSFDLCPRFRIMDRAARPDDKENVED